MSNTYISSISAHAFLMLSLVTIVVYKSIMCI